MDMQRRFSRKPKDCDHLADGEAAFVDLDDEHVECLLCGEIIKKEEEVDRNPVDSDHNLGTDKGSGTY